MSLTSPAFFLLVALSVLAFHVSASVPYRRFVLGVANAVFLTSYVSTPAELLPLGAFLAIGYVAVNMVRRRPGTATLAVGISVILVCYIVLKRFSFLQPIVELPFPYLTLGLSYVLFRMLQLMIDVQADESCIGHVGVLTYFRFTCNFLTFVSGPIQRFQDFTAADGREEVPLDTDRVYAAFSRFI